jgi:hypothetical protein
LTILLQLLRTPEGARKIPDARELHDEARDLMHVFAVLSAAFPPLLRLRQEYAKLQALLPLRQNSSDLLDLALQNEASVARTLLAEIHQALGATAYPFSHAKGHVSLIDFARSKEYEADPLLMVSKESESHLQMLFALYFQLLGRLTEIASQVEQHF